MKKTPEELINDIQEACKALGWNIGMDSSKKIIKGLIIGENKYVESVITQLQEVDGYEIFAAGNSEPDFH